MTTERQAIWWLAAVIAVAVVGYNCIPEKPKKLSPEQEAELDSMMASVERNLDNFQTNRDRDNANAVAKMEAELKAFDADESQKAAVAKAKAAVLRTQQAWSEAKAAIKDAQEKTAIAASAHAEVTAAKSVIDQAEQANKSKNDAFQKRDVQTPTTSSTR